MSSVGLLVYTLVIALIGGIEVGPDLLTIVVVALVVRQDQSAQLEAVQVHTALVITRVLQILPMSMAIMRRDQGRGNVAPRGITYFMTKLRIGMMMIMIMITMMMVTSIFIDHLLTIRQWPRGHPQPRTLHPRTPLQCLLLLLLPGLGFMPCIILKESLK